MAVPAPPAASLLTALSVLSLAGATFMPGNGPSPSSLIRLPLERVTPHGLCPLYHQRGPGPRRFVFCPRSKREPGGDSSKASKSYLTLHLPQVSHATIWKRKLVVLHSGN